MEIVSEHGTIVTAMVNSFFAGPLVNHLVTLAGPGWHYDRPV